MHIEFSPKAVEQLTNIIDGYLEYCGERSALKFSTTVDEKLNTLLKFPESGFPEPLLKDKEIFYRAKIINKNYKLIYWVDADVIRVSAIWDMRMNPVKLVKMF